MSTPGHPDGGTGSPSAVPYPSPFPARTVDDGRETTGPVTGRSRRVVEGLPDWDPLPPGEAVVRRPGTAR